MLEVIQDLDKRHALQRSSQRTYHPDEDDDVDDEADSSHGQVEVKLLLTQAFRYKRIVLT